LIAGLAVELLNTGIMQPQIAISPSYLFAILFVPIYDMARVLLIRTLNGRSPFIADRNHTHHMILRYGFGHRSVSLMLAAINLMILSLHQFVPGLSSHWFMLMAPLLVISILNHKVLTVLAKIHHRAFRNPAASTLYTK
jgi:hypothetical protein